MARARPTQRYEFATGLEVGDGGMSLVAGRGDEDSFVLDKAGAGVVEMILERRKHAEIVDDRTIGFDDVQGRGLWLSDLLAAGFVRCERFPIL